MNRHYQYFKGFKVAFEILLGKGLGSRSNSDGFGAKPGEPLDKNLQNRYNSIERAFNAVENLPSATSTTDEPPNRSP